MLNPTDWVARFETALQDHVSNDGSHDIGHIRRVRGNALAIAEIEGGDQEILVAAAYFHDLINPPKNSRDRVRASALSAEAALPILRRLDFPIDKLAATAHAIEAHSFSAQIQPTTLEAKIFQDADCLDALGAIGIARTFYVAGQMNSRLVHIDDPLASNRELDDRRYAIDHFAVKLFKIAETLNTDTARKISQGRVRLMRQFFEQLQSEL